MFPQGIGAMFGVLRVWAGCVSFAYAGIIVLVVVVLAMQGDLGDLVSAARLLVVVVIAIAVFVWSLIVWDRKVAWVARLLSWMIIAASTGYTLISFSFILAPLLFSTILVLWPWQVVWRRKPSHGR